MLVQITLNRTGIFIIILVGAYYCHGHVEIAISNILARYSYDTAVLQSHYYCCTQVSTICIREGAGSRHTPPLFSLLGIYMPFVAAPPMPPDTE